MMSEFKDNINLTMGHEDWADLIGVSMGSDDAKPFQKVLKLKLDTLQAKADLFDELVSALSALDAGSSAYSVCKSDEEDEITVLLQKARALQEIDK